MTNPRSRQALRQVRKAHRVMSLMLDAAVKDARLSRNPATGVELPRLRAKEPRFLTADQVQMLALAAGDYGALILLLSTTGLRFGEATALRVADIDLLRREVRVSRSVSEVDGQLVWSTPKTHASRTVALPPFLVNLLTTYLAGKGTNDLAFTSPSGSVLRNQNFRRRCWQRAVQDVGVDGLTPHDLRHTAASLAVEAGANVLAVSKMLGHASPVLTLTTYSHLFDTHSAEVADRMQSAFSNQLAASVRPEAPSAVVDIRRSKA